MELLGTVTIDRYIRVVQTVEARRATHYKRGEDIPKKYSDKLGKEYHWMFIAKKKAEYLVDADGDLVVKNINSQGTPRFKVINGQDLHMLTLQPYDRSRIIKAIKEQMTPEIEKLNIITKYPVRILCELHDTFMDMVYIKKDGKPKDIDWDIDNRGLFYCKTFADVLSGTPTAVIATDEFNKPMKNHKTGKVLKKMAFLSKRVIPNDHRKYITQPPVPLFFPIEDTQQRKLVFKIYHDDREIIKSHEQYREFGVQEGNTII